MERAAAYGTSSCKRSRQVRHAMIALHNCLHIDLNELHAFFLIWFCMDSTTALMAALRSEEDESEQLMEFEENFDNFDFEPPRRNTHQ